MRQLSTALIFGMVVVGTSFAESSKNKAEVMRECRVEVTEYTMPVRREIAQLKSEYKLLKEVELKQDNRYRSLTSELHQIRNSEKDPSKTDSLRQRMMEIRTELATARQALQDTDKLKALKMVVNEQEEEIRTLAAQAKKNSAVCGQAYAGE